MKSAIFAVFVIAFSAHSAFAVSTAVKMACKDDYFTHCSMHAVGSPGVRQCMRAVGPRLSQRCIGALAAAGEIKKSDKVASKTKAQKATKLAAVKGRKAGKAMAKASVKTKLAKKAGGKKQLAKLNKANKAGAKKQMAKGSSKKTQIASKATGKAPPLKRGDNGGLTAKQRYAAQH